MVHDVKELRTELQAGTLADCSVVLQPARDPRSAIARTSEQVAAQISYRNLYAGAEKAAGLKYCATRCAVVPWV